jgi:hypothetical protein
MHTENAMRIERIDTDEIVGLNCPATGNRILWADEDIEDVLPGTVVLAVLTNLCPDECAVDGLPLAAAWNQHYASVDTRKLTLDEIVEAFPASGKALKVCGGGMACSPVFDVTYFIVPEELPVGCFIHADAAHNTAPDAEAPRGQKSF